MSFVTDVTYSLVDVTGSSQLRSGRLYLPLYLPSNFVRREGGGGTGVGRDDPVDRRGDSEKV